MKTIQQHIANFKRLRNAMDEAIEEFEKDFPAEPQAPRQRLNNKKQRVAEYELLLMKTRQAKPI